MKNVFNAPVAKEMKYDEGKTDTLGIINRVTNDPVDLSQPLDLRVFQNYDRTTEIPIVIGGMPGSGTRTMVWIVQSLNTFMGWEDYDNYLLGTRDAIHLGWWMANYAMHYMDGRVQHFTDDMIERMWRSLDIALDAHLIYRRNEPHWGWKQPNIMHVIGLIKQHLPKTKYIHILRDPRDISYAWKDMIRFTHAHVIGDTSLSTDILYMDLWNNLQKETFKQLKNMFDKEDYFIVKFEDIVQAPYEILESMKKFIGEEKVKESNWLKKIVPPPTIGRWKREGYESDKELVTGICEPLLRHFEYEV